MTLRGQVLLILLAVLAAFSPAPGGEICPIDDASLFQHLGSHPPKLLDVIARPGENVLYYRPLLGLTYWADARFFGANPFWMHLENLLFHLASTLLLFALCRKFFRDEAHRFPYLPLGIALLWGVHPLASESVNWISGRTDLLAALFVLASAFSILRCRDGHRTRWIILGVLCWFLAMAAKEVAVAFFPGGLLLLAANDGETGRPAGWRRALVLFSIVGMAALALFLFLRGAVSLNHSSRIDLTVAAIRNNPVHSLTLCARALGFYLKKIFLPLPLNFAIIEVDPLYDLLGGTIALICLFLFLKRTTTAALFLAGVFLLGPSFLIVQNQIAWTPFAERYAYLPAAFILPATVGWLVGRRPRKVPAKALGIACGVAVLVFGGISFQRSLTWRSGFAIVEDTARKAPLSRQVQMVYGGLLADRNRLDEAYRVTRRALSIPAFPLARDARLELNLAGILLAMGRPEEALSLYQTILDRSPEEETALQGVFDSAALLARRAEAPREQARWFFLAVQSGEKLHERTNDPMIWYNLGKLALAIGREGEAKRFFAMAFQDFAPGHPYKEFARRLAGA